jgi:predicted ferric reductase
VRVAAPRRWWADVIGVAAMLNVLVVVAMWVHGGGVADLRAPGTGSTSIGRLTGLLSAVLLLAQVLLMARVPWLERSYGQDRLARWHRITGFVSFDLMLAHTVLITIGYAATGHTGLLRQAWELVATYPGMLLATAALAALCLVVATSVRAARRRLRYESWHLLHLYAYLGIGLALPHELWTGADFVSSPAARAYWWTLYGVAAGSVLLFRLGLPLWRSLLHGLVVSKVVREVPGVVSVYLRGRHLDRLPAAAGQFFLWRFLDGPGWSRANPYSLSAAPRPDLLRITVKDLGDGSRRLSTLRPGTRVLIEGPYGTLTADRQDRPRVLLLAAGVGITPIRALLEELPYQPGDATLLYRVTSQDNAVFADELNELATRRGIQVHYLAGPRRRATSWLPAGSGTEYGDAEHLRRLVPDVAERDVYLCGPSPWMAAVRAAALGAGVPTARLHDEDFAW